jgi:hypothetical protein
MSVLVAGFCWWSGTTASRRTTIRMTFDRYGHLPPNLDERVRDGA